MAAIEHAGVTRSRPAPRAGGWSGHPRAWTGWPRGWFATTSGVRPGFVDLVVAGALAVFQVAGTIMYAEDEPSPWALDRGAFILLLAGPVALLWRRRWPEATLVVTAIAAAGYAASGYPRGPACYPALTFALAGAVMMGRRRWAWGVLAAAYPALVGLPSVNPDELEAARSVASVATDFLWLPVVVAVAELAHVGLERRAEVARREEEHARRRASEERLRIARELHDVLAHNIALIKVQSGVALHLMDERPEHARPALEAVHEASSAALGELRSVLDVLRRGPDDGEPGDGEPGGVAADAGTDTGAPRTPAAGLGDLDALVRRTRSAGLDVSLVIEGAATALPASVDLAAYRIVQEALTNAVRHAPGGRATVTVVYADELVVRVDDDGARTRGPAHRPAPGQAGGGRGLAGMRERAHALGGTFTAEPRAGVGFRVEAHLPLGEATG